MANSTDNLDASGLMPGAAPWDLTPDAGQEAPGFVTPRYGADIKYTQAYPSQEPPAAAPWPRDDVSSLVADRNANPIRHGAEIRNDAQAQGTTQADGYGVAIGSTDRYSDLGIPSNVPAPSTGPSQDGTTSQPNYPAQGQSLRPLDGPAVGRM